ncbi:relaxase domain-containing protein [Phytoactinopolyspora halotolerans]|uniref:Relaxase domain-containing protein n=2 Tax=Phytoactinopolyspora halotolerans TaxID=1981512 RepID=A0A6L9S913_9ACTN|nr:relaxase domain-containing protein [Phytoactinopolyspora halotolerans]
MSIKKLHAGDGYTYLLRGVADGEGMPGVISPMTRYYAESGHPPGRWMGTGLVGLANGDGVPAGSMVNEQQMERLFKDGTDPVTAVALGQRYAHPRSWRERADARIRALPATLTADERAARTCQIEDEERRRPTRRPVAGFDCVFSPPKSVSVLWALTDHQTRVQIARAHHDAVDQVLRVMERDVARTRIGTDGVAQVQTRGVVATAFDHYDSRAGDPQLHTHVVIANRVQGPDGKWRTLDSRGSLFPAAVAMSELYDTLIADRLTADLGLGWERRGTPVKPKNQTWEIIGVPDELITEFSQRAASIEAVKDDLIQAYREAHDHDPDDATIVRLRQQATYTTRPDKTLRSLQQMIAGWRTRASRVLKRDSAQWATSVVAHSRTSPAPPEDAQRLVEEFAHAALAELSEQRSTWRTWNVRAAAARASMPHRIASADERHALIDAITQRVAELSVCITPPELTTTPTVFRRADGSSAFTRDHDDVFTTTEILAAEDRLLAAADSLTAPVVDLDVVTHATGSTPPGATVLSDDQAAAVAQITTSQRVVDVLVGPAGSGKTTALASLRAAWEAQHGPGSVIGLAPSAAAAEVLRHSLAVTTENTAKWLHESTGLAAHRRRERYQDLLARRAALPAHAADRLDTALAAIAHDQRQWSFQPGQLVIVDEATLAGTLTLDALRAQAEHAGAKLLLVGDWAQLSSVEAGGAFGMLVRARGDRVPELTGARRFAHDWERAASIQLRTGDTDVIKTYLAHDRIRDGDTEQILKSVYQAWLADENAGQRSLLVAADAATVRELNLRARADRIANGAVTRSGAILHDGTHAGRGDRVVTRHNDRSLASGPHSWVKNGDQWTVTRQHCDGALTVKRAHGGAIIKLPAAYVAEHVELAYASTVYRAQGSTVDTCHAVVTETDMTRETLYVAMTRGRLTNTAHVVTDQLDEEICDDETHLARDILIRVMQRSGAELSAHETIAAEQDQAVSIAKLAAEYETLAREAATSYWTGLLAAPLFSRTAADPTHSPSYPAFVAAVRHAEAAGLEANHLVPRLATTDDLRAADDPLDVLSRRIAQVTDHAAATRPDRTRHRLIAELIPTATHVSDPDMERALRDRETLLENRAATLTREVLAQQPPWLTELGPTPSDRRLREQWLQHLTTVAVYRARHGLRGDDALGDEHNQSWSYRADRRRARHAIEAARHISDTPDSLRASRRQRHRARPNNTTSL